MADHSLAHMETELHGFNDTNTYKLTQNKHRKRRDDKTKQSNEQKKTKPDTDEYTEQAQKQTQDPKENLNTQTTNNTTNTQKPEQHQNTKFTIKPQQNNTNKEFKIKNNTYNVVFIEPISIKEGETLLEPMEVGKFLYEVKLDQFAELKRAGQYRYKLTYKKPQDTEKILNSAPLLKENNYRAFIPKMLTETTGVIKDVPTSLTEHEIYEKIISSKKVIKVDRIKRKKGDSLVNTRSVKITVEGSELPRVIQLYGVLRKPELYIYPVRICNKCWRFGHKAAACKGKLTCQRCGKMITDEHSGCDATTPAKCKNCGRNHLPTDAAMTINKMTFSEAEEMYPRTSNQYAILESMGEFPGLEHHNRPVTGFRQVERASKKNDYS
ncbi:uncharacterized protein LOC134209536 [Armigeres subalbatus]|uniref:uncharacterized protein LOC134209536 n=1 Tax=Armigeres subalbatus TaxID=124917 RepID=UPI002ED6B43C